MSTINSISDCPETIEKIIRKVNSNLQNGYDFLEALRDKVYVFGEIVSDSIIRESKMPMADAHANLVQDSFDNIQREFGDILDSLKRALEETERKCCANQDRP